MVLENYRILIISVYLLASLLVLPKVLIEDKFRKTLSNYSNYILVALLLFYIVIFGFRDLSIGSDTQSYHFKYMMYDRYDFGPDFIMNYLMKGLNFFSNSSTAFFVCMAIIYICSMYFAIINFSLLFESSTFLIFFSFLSFFFFYNLGVNIIRQGVSLSLFLMGTSYYLRSRRVLYLVCFCILSTGFHITSLIPFFVLFFVLFFKRISITFFIIGYLITILLTFKGFSFLDVQDIMTTALLGDKFNIYLTNESAVYDIGFRPQFVIFNTIFLCIFLLVRKICSHNKDYDDLLKVYLVLSAVFFMAFQMPYSDRWGIMSWVLLPILFSPVFSLKFRFRISTMAFFFHIVIFILFFRNLNQF